MRSRYSSFAGLAWLRPPLATGDTSTGWHWHPRCPRHVGNYNSMQRPIFGRHRWSFLESAGIVWNFFEHSELKPPTRSSLLINQNFNKWSPPKITIHIFRKKIVQIRKNDFPAATKLFMAVFRTYRTPVIHICLLFITSGQFHFQGIWPHSRTFQNSCQQKWWNVHKGQIFCWN